MESCIRRGLSEGIFCNVVMYIETGGGLCGRFGFRRNWLGVLSSQALRTWTGEVYEERCISGELYQDKIASIE